MGSSVLNSHLTIMFSIFGLVATFAVAHVKGQCQQPGNAKCYSISAPVGPVGSCCSGAQCQPGLAPGETFTKPVDWYCQYIEPIALNGACDSFKGKCATGLNCIAGVCSDQATTTAASTSAASTAASTTAASTTAASTTAAATTAAAPVTGPGGCQQPTNAKCYSISAPVGPVGSGCCSGAQCQPWLEPGETYTKPVDWYCQYIEPIALNGACDYKQGKCATGLNCIDGACSDQATTTAASTTAASDGSTTDGSTTDGSTTNGSTSDGSTTDGSTSEASTTGASTTAEVCDKQSGDLCLDTKYNIKGTCCSPYVCTSVTERSSLCKPELQSDLAEGAACFENGVGSLGSCADPLICLNDVCTKQSASCIDPVNGLCFSSDLGVTVGSCCTGSYCVAVEGVSDRFCQSVVPAGGNCGNATVIRGFCMTGSYCIDSICTDGTKTTTTTSTTTSSTTTSSTTSSTTSTAACIASGSICLDLGTGSGGTCCSGAGDCSVFDPAGIKCT